MKICRENLVVTHRPHPSNTTVSIFFAIQLRWQLVSSKLKLWINSFSFLSFFFLSFPPKHVVCMANVLDNEHAGNSCHQNLWNYCRLLSVSFSLSQIDPISSGRVTSLSYLSILNKILRRTTLLFVSLECKYLVDDWKSKKTKKLFDRPWIRVLLTLSRKDQINLCNTTILFSLFLLSFNLCLSLCQIGRASCRERV